MHHVDVVARTLEVDEGEPVGRVAPGDRGARRDDPAHPGEHVRQGVGRPVRERPQVQVARPGAVRHERDRRPVRRPLRVAGGWLDFGDLKLAREFDIDRNPFRPRGGEERDAKGSEDESLEIGLRPPVARESDPAPVRRPRRVEIRVAVLRQGPQVPPVHAHGVKVALPAAQPGEHEGLSVRRPRRVEHAVQLDLDPAHDFPLRHLVDVRSRTGRSPGPTGRRVLRRPGRAPARGRTRSSHASGGTRGP